VSLSFLLLIFGMLKLTLQVFHLFAELGDLLGLQVLCHLPLFHFGSSQAACGKGLAKLSYGLLNQVVFIVSHKPFPLFGKQ